MSKLNFDMCWSTLTESIPISPTIKNDTWIEMSSQVLPTSYNMKTQRFYFILKKKSESNPVSAVMFCKQYLAYAVHIDRSAFLCNP